jgi:hypothetical protein
MSHSATPRLITHPAAISTALLVLPSGPATAIHGNWVNTCEPAPAAIAYARIIHARCVATSRRRIAATPSTSDSSIPLPNSSRSPVSTAPVSAGCS